MDDISWIIANYTNNGILDEAHIYQQVYAPFKNSALIFAVIQIILWISFTIVYKYYDNLVDKGITEEYLEYALSAVWAGYASMVMYSLYIIYVLYIY